MGAPRATPLERFWRHVVVVIDGCWWWKGCLSQAGYGRFTVSAQQRAQAAHRLAYEFFRGPIPEGLTIDHLCGNTACVNPAHLEPVTQGVNVMRSPHSASGANARKTHCPRGHEYNRRRSNGWRICGTCANEARRARKEGVSA